MNIREIINEGPMIPLVIWRLPESLDFLIAKRPANVLQRLNKLLLHAFAIPLVIAMLTTIALRDA